MIFREMKIKDHDGPVTMCFFCLLKSAYELGGSFDPKKMAEGYIDDYVSEGEGTIHCHHCGPVRYVRYKKGWVEVRLNAVPL